MWEFTLLAIIFPLFEPIKCHWVFKAKNLSFRRIKFLFGAIISLLSNLKKKFYCILHDIKIAILAYLNKVANLSRIIKRKLKPILWSI